VAICNKKFRKYLFMISAPSLLMGLAFIFLIKQKCFRFEGPLLTKHVLKILRGYPQ
jgi:hypothetical protein